jgi:hypothetical protein
VRDLLFDTPWWLLTLIGVSGVALFMSGNSRQNKQLLRGGVGVILLGVLLAVVSYLVDTPREKAIKGTHALVAAAVARDGQTLGSYLHPAAALAGWNRKQIIEGAPIYADRFGLKGATITGWTLRKSRRWSRSRCAWSRGSRRRACPTTPSPPTGNWTGGKHRRASGC